MGLTFLSIGVTLPDIIASLLVVRRGEYSQVAIHILHDYLWQSESHRAAILVSVTCFAYCGNGGMQVLLDVMRLSYKAPDQTCRKPR